MAPTIGIISIGQMGLDIAQVLKDQNYRVVTNATERRYSSTIALVKKKNQLS